MEMTEKKYHIEADSVQETLVIPLYGRKICSDLYPDLFYDPLSVELIEKLDYDFEGKGKKMEGFFGKFGALEVAQRQYDIICEVKNYLLKHPYASVVSLGCGLDSTFRYVDNGLCRGYNLDLPDVISLRRKLLPAGEREENIACDLNNHTWMDRIPSEDGAVFFATGVFYYFTAEQVREMFRKMALLFPKGVVVFDACGRTALKLMMKTWVKEAGIKDIGAYFPVEDAAELAEWSDHFASVTSKGYMTGYRDISDVIGPVYRTLCRFCDDQFRMQIIRIAFTEKGKTAEPVRPAEKKKNILVRYFSQTGKPEGTLGKMMLAGMNSGHAALADWGMKYLKNIEPEKIADLGCGGGRNAGVLLEKYPGAHITAADHSALSVSKAKEYNRKAIEEGRMEILEADVSALPLNSDEYDLVTAFETVYFWPGPQKSFREVCRILKPGGQFMIVNESDGRDKTGKYFETVSDGMKTYTEEELISFLKDAGFSKAGSIRHPKKPWITVIGIK